MRDQGPTRVLLASMKKAMRVWAREMRARRGRRLVGRTAAAAAVTLAAGMVAGPATAAVDPSGDNQQVTNAPSGDTQVAVRGARPGPPPPMRAPLEVPRNSPAPPQRQQPIPPQRTPGELDPATRDQVERAQDLRDSLGRFNRQKGWDKLEDELSTELEKDRKEADDWRTPEEAPVQPYDPANPLAPPPLSQDEVDALNRQQEAMEPPGYVNQFREFSVNPLGRDLDKSNVDREIDRSFLNDPVNAPHNQDKLNDFRSRLHDAIDGVHDAQTEQDRQAAQDKYNEAARDFNAAEQSERDNYGGNEEGRQVPKHKSDLPPGDEEQPPGPTEQGLPPTRNPDPADPDDTQDNDNTPQMDSARSRAQDDPNYDGPTPDDAPQMDSPRSQAQDDLNYDGPTPDDTPQMDSPRSQAQDDPNYDSPAPDAPTDPDAPAPGVDPNADPTSDPQGDTISGGYGEDSLGSYTGDDDSLGTESNDAIAGAAGEDSMAGMTGEDGLGADSDSISGGYGTDSLGGDLGGDSLGGDSTGLGGDSTGLGGDSMSGMSGDSTGGMSGDSSGGFGGDSGGMGGDSSGSMGSDSGGMGGDSSGGMGGDSGGMSGDSSGGMGGDSSGGMGGDSGGMGGDSSGGMGGDSSGGMGGGDSSGGMGGGDSGGGMGGMSSGGMGGDGGF